MSFPVGPPRAGSWPVGPSTNGAKGDRKIQGGRDAAIDAGRPVPSGVGYVLLQLCTPGSQAPIRWAPTRSASVDLLINMLLG